MTGSTFKKGIEKALLSVGFARAGNALVRHDGGVWTMVSCEKGFGDQWSINVGFWLEELDANRPDRVEQSHLYFRLERLTPLHRETILQAGSLQDPEQAKAYAELISMLGTGIDAELRSLGTYPGLRAAMAEGRLVNGLVKKNARDKLRS